MRIATERDQIARRTTTSSLLSPAVLQVERQKRLRKLLIWGGRLLLIAAVLLFWQVGAVMGLLKPLFYSHPLAIWQQLLDWGKDGTLWSNTSLTLEETFLGLLYGTITGMLAGFILGFLPTLSQILDPIINALNSIPKIALAPLFIIWFGIGTSMKVNLATLTVFFIIFVNTIAGMRDVDINLINAVRLMGAKRWDIVLKVMFPSALGYIFTGLRVAIPYAFVGAIIGELIASNRGLGYLVDYSADTFDTAGVFAGIAMITLIAVVLNTVVTVFDRYTSRWKPRTDSHARGGNIVF